jgi:uncharacterized membrane protein
MAYAPSILILACTILAFFLLARGRYASFGIPQVLLRILVALPLLLSAVLLHFFRTDASASMIPPAFPMPHLLVLITGVLEIVGAIGLFVPTFRRRAALWIAILMTAVFPANVYVAGQTIGSLQMPGVSIRLAMQIVYVLTVLLAGYGLPGRGSTGSESVEPRR